MNYVVPPVIFGAEVDVMVIDGGDAPKVTGDQIVAEDGLVIG